MAEVDPRFLLVFGRAYAHRQRTGERPTVEDLQRELASERINVLVREVANQARNHISINAPDHRVKLSLRAQALLPAATPLLGVTTPSIDDTVGPARERILHDRARFGRSAETGT